MAKKPQGIAPIKISAQAEKNFIAYGQKLLTQHKRRQEQRTKMEIIDVAYARYKASNGTDAEAAQQACDIFAKDEVTPPLVVSQVDSMVAYWADVFLSGYPLFPVVSLPSNRQWAEQLEALLDDHATLGGYARQLLLFLIDGGKYNFCALEADWDQVHQFSVMSDYLADKGQSISRDAKYFTRLKRLDPYNVVYDDTVAPGDLAAEGDYAGYLGLESRTKLKRRLNKYSDAREVYNAAEAMALETTNAGGTWGGYYTMPPQVSDYVSTRRPTDDVDWAPWFGEASLTERQRQAGRADNYEVFTYYARILPSDFGLQAPQPNTHQIWKVVMVNNSVLVHAKRIINAYDLLPILFGQPIEDGLGYQTESVAEGAIGFQEAAKTLYNIRFAAARRAVSDRALYDPDLIAPSLINSKAAAPKIPVSIPSITGKKISDAYHQIPFDLRGTETTLQDAGVISEFAKELRGLNNAQRGQFQKGNKSVVEWQDTMGASDNRLRLSALCLEHQVFVPLKETLKFNIFQSGDNIIVVSQKSGEILDINIAELRKQVLSFRLGDGYSPKAKMASVDMITTGLQMISTMPGLQAQYGAALPSIFAHLMQLGGVRGLEQYMIQSPAQQPGGLVAAGIGPGGNQPAPALAPTAPSMPQEPMDMTGADDMANMMSGMPGAMQ